MTVVTRFAPSPTGSLHVGGARTALYCMLHARHHGGRFVLRIEDTDRVRSTEAATEGILRDLRWLGLAWDEGPDRDGGRGPYLQSQRRDRYEAVFRDLLAGGHAYEAWETREELETLREQARAAKEDFRYRRIPYTDADLARFRAEGRTPVLRLRAPEHTVRVQDAILGPVVVEPEQLEDIVIRKADGWPTYHFAVVVDDHDMEVTQVLRGQEHLLNTPKHLGLMEALGWEPPAFGHLPLIFNPSGSKMSKRDKAKAARAAARESRDARGETGWEWLAEATGLDEPTLVRFQKKKTDDLGTAEAIARTLQVDLPMIEVSDFRAAGYLPEALNNYLALLGWNPGPDPDTGEERELMDLATMVELWDLSRVGRTPARFDPDKLRWMNGEYLRSLPDAVVTERLQQWFAVVDSPLEALDPALRDRVLALYRPRANTFAELERAAAYVWDRPTAYDEKAVKKWIHRGEGLGLRLLAAARPRLEAAPWTEAGLEEAITGLARDHDAGLGRIAQPLRLALSGAAATPGLWETLTLFSRDEVLARVDAALTAFEG